LLIKSNGGTNQWRADLNRKTLLHKGHTRNLERPWGSSALLDLRLRHTLFWGLAPDIWLGATLTLEFSIKRHRQHSFLYIFLGHDDLVPHPSCDNKSRFRTSQQNPSLWRKNTPKQLILFHHTRERRHLPRSCSSQKDEIEKVFTSRH
jgi:hypothetical protein